MNIADLRENYAQGTLDVTDVAPTPLAQFERWFEQALSAQLREPNAMVLSTVSANGAPSARVVLLKGLEEGFTFFTNYESQKGQQIAAHPVVALTFFWNELERQVRIEGRIERVSAQESDEYFAVRPRSSQIGAWVSPQSTVIESRQWLEDRQAALEAQWQDQAIPRPEHWGGYRVVPHYMEFWQGRPSRLHDRIAYTQQPDGSWRIERLSP
jgi:pyridoxamine 5'-phosphate oxidase